mmetsp:Transcript_6864/g.18580  ORF Transcript_6864/g.18580 Transcript_6864/m.18580 type:complete len:220 (-) Transcript_6864:2842-3501(-)
MIISRPHITVRLNVHAMTRRPRLRCPRHRERSSTSAADRPILASLRVTPSGNATVPMLPLPPAYAGTTRPALAAAPSLLERKLSSEARVSPPSACRTGATLLGASSEEARCTRRWGALLRTPAGSLLPRRAPPASPGGDGPPGDGGGLASRAVAPGGLLLVRRRSEKDVCWEAEAEVASLPAAAGGNGGSVPDPRLPELAGSWGVLELRLWPSLTPDGA